jgi:hypothetical protein
MHMHSESLVEVLEGKKRLSSSINFNEYLSESRSIIIYGNNKNSYIFSRIYNGV